MVGDLNTLQWVLLALGAFVTGLSKTGIAGLGILSVVLFANALPAKSSTGALLPLLVAADLIGVAIFRKHANWKQLWRLFPWVAGGVVRSCVTHDIGETLGFDRVLVVVGGRLVEDGRPQDLVAQDGSAFQTLYRAEEQVRSRMWSGPGWRQHFLEEGRVREAAP